MRGGALQHLRQLAGLLAQAIDLAPSTPDEFARVIARDIGTWSRVVKTGNIKVN